MPSACRRASAVTGRLKSFRLSRVRPSSRLLCEYCRFHRRCCNPFDCNAASFFRGNSTDAAKPQAVADSSVHADPTAVVAPLQSTNKSNPPPGNIMAAQNRHGPALVQQVIARESPQPGQAQNDVHQVARPTPACSATSHLGARLRNRWSRQVAKHCVRGKRYGHEVTLWLWPA